MNKTNQSVEKNPRGKKCVKLKLDMKKLETMVTLDDFFIFTGMSSYLKDGTLFDVRQTVMNEITGDQILDLWKNNWKKNKELKHYKKEYAMRILNFNWMNYSPVYDSKIPEGYIYIYPKKKEEIK